MKKHSSQYRRADAATSPAAVRGVQDKQGATGVEVVRLYRIELKTVVLENLIVAERANKFIVFYESRRLVSTSRRHCILCTSN
jgi:hypothetical protein